MTHEPTFSTRAPICPHCGQMVKDPGELFDGDYDRLVETTCSGCDNDFEVTAHLSISYRSTVRGSQ